MNIPLNIPESQIKRKNSLFTFGFVKTIKTTENRGILYLNTIENRGIFNSKIPNLCYNSNLINHATKIESAITTRKRSKYHKRLQFLKEFNDVEFILDNKDSQVLLNMLMEKRNNRNNLNKLSNDLFDNVNIDDDVIDINEIIED